MLVANRRLLMAVLLRAPDLSILYLYVSLPFVVAKRRRFICLSLSVPVVGAVLSLSVGATLVACAVE